MAVSANYPQGQPWRAAALDEPGDLMPVDVVRVGLGERFWNPEAFELRHPPCVDQVLVTLDCFAGSDQLGWLHRSFLQPARSGDRPSLRSGDAHRRPAPVRSRLATLQASRWSERAVVPQSGRFTAPT